MAVRMLYMGDRSYPDTAALRSDWTVTAPYSRTVIVLGAGQGKSRITSYLRCTAHA